MKRAGANEGALSVSDPEPSDEEERRDPAAAAASQPAPADPEEDSNGDPGHEPDESPADPAVAPAVDGEAQAAAAAEDAAVAQDEAAAGPGPGDALSDDELLQAVTALIYASPEPLGSGRLVRLLERPANARVAAALATLGQRLEASGLPIELRQLAGGWQIVTQSALGEVVARLFQERKTERISAAALETLAIVAYRQPVTKAEIEAIRGVQAGPILRNLVDRGLARVSGRADQPGHPLQYGTTRSFLDRFGLGSLEELPRDGELAGDS